MSRTSLITQLSSDLFAIDSKAMSFPFFSFAITARLNREGSA